MWGGDAERMAHTTHVQQMATSPSKLASLACVNGLPIGNVLSDRCLLSVFGCPSSRRSFSKK